MQFYRSRLHEKYFNCFGDGLISVLLGVLCEVLALSSAVHCPKPGTTAEGAEVFAEKAEGIGNRSLPNLQLVCRTRIKPLRRCQRVVLLFGSYHAKDSQTQNDGAGEYQSSTSHVRNGDRDHRRQRLRIE